MSNLVNQFKHLCAFLLLSCRLRYYPNKEMWWVRSVWGQLILWHCVGPYMEVWFPQWLKMVQRHTLYLDVWRWSLVGLDTCLFETGCIKFRAIVSQQLVDRFQPFFSGVGKASKLFPVKNKQICPCLGQETNHIPQSRSRNLPILGLRALLRKNQTAITSSMLGVRSSSLWYQTLFFKIESQSANITWEDKFLILICDCGNCMVPLWNA